jgi:azurin
MNNYIKGGFFSAILLPAFLFIPSIPVFGQVPADTLRVQIHAVSGMQYDLVRFAVKPGSWVKLVLANTDDMEHNLVIGRKGSREKIVAAALSLGKDGPAAAYIPKVEEVLHSIPVLKPGEADSIVFRVPRSAGVYPYVCTFPGHGNIMYGAMHVSNGVMPRLLADLNIPEHRRKGEENDTKERPSGHPFTLVPPYHYRVLMPDAGPAAIAVCLPHDLAYCWDAGACRLRYAWTGEFLDLTDYWTIKGELHAKILGTVFYRDQSAFPLRLGHFDSIPSVKFKGYRLIRGYPEFHYLINGYEVFELITPVGKGEGLIRQIRIRDADRPVWFIHGSRDGVVYRSDKGHWVENQLRLDPKEAAQFTITMMKSGQ